jgi:hypothetical protein
MATSTLVGFLPMVAKVDVRDAVSRIAAPKPVVATTRSGPGSVETVRAWRQRIPGSRLAFIGIDSYHVVASDANEVALLVGECLPGSGHG